jgi:hypothetical protein
MSLPIDALEEELCRLMFDPKKNAARIEYLRKVRELMRPKVLRQSVGSNEYQGSAVVAVKW